MGGRGKIALAVAIKSMQMGLRPRKRKNPVERGRDASKNIAVCDG